MLHDTELTHRINCGWAKFHAQKKILCSKHYPLQDRLRLFEATVTPSVLYACGGWTMKASRENSLRVAQRSMLRRIVQVGRRSAKTEDSGDGDESSQESTQTSDAEADIGEPVGAEPWVDWIRRSTMISEQLGAKARVSDWVAEQRRRKLSWAGRVLSRTDGRWTTQALHWLPTGGARKVGRPVRKWLDMMPSNLI